MTIALEMKEDGTSLQVELTQSRLESDKVYCVIDAQTHSIYIWLGRNAGVRKRFVGAHTAARLRNEQGSHYKVRPVEEGDEPPVFLRSL